MFLLVPAHLGFPGQIPQSRKTVVCMYEYARRPALLVGRQEGHPACKILEWWDAGVVIRLG